MCLSEKNVLEPENFFKSSKLAQAIRGCLTVQGGVFVGT